MKRDAIDAWSEKMPDVSDRRALQRWLDAMPKVRDAPRPSGNNDELIYKTVERPPPVAEETPQTDLIDIARSEAMHLVEALAEEVGADLGKLEQRVRELEVQLGLERRIRELELKLGKLSADMDADHSRTAAPLIPLKGGAAVQPRNAQFLVAWNRTDLMTRLSILARSVVNGQRADLAVSKLIALVAVMASQLSSEARVAIAQQLRDEADMLAPPLERRALH